MFSSIEPDDVAGSSNREEMNFAAVTIKGNGVHFARTRDIRNIQLLVVRSRT